MNDRLADLQGEVPAWAVEDGPSHDIEVGQSPEPVPNPGVVPSSSSGPSWLGKNDDFDDFQDQKFVEEPVNGANPQQPPPDEEQKEDQMGRFFKEKDRITSSIESITAATRRIGEMNLEAFSVNESGEKKLSAEMGPLIQKTNKLAKATKDTLSVLKAENKQFEADKTLKSADMRVRQNLCTTLTRAFIDEMKLYQNAQQKYKIDIKNKAQRQILNARPDASEEEVDMIMKSEGGKEGLYQQTILQGGVNDNIKQAYSKVAGKYQDILILEQSVTELHQMFLDFALLTEQQGELIDQIEYNVEGAVNYVEDANVDVYEAIKLGKKARKKQCCIILIVVVVVIILLFSTGILRI